VPDKTTVDDFRIDLGGGLLLHPGDAVSIGTLTDALGAPVDDTARLLTWKGDSEGMLRLRDLVFPGLEVRLAQEPDAADKEAWMIYGAVRSTEGKASVRGLAVGMTQAEVLRRFGTGSMYILFDGTRNGITGMGIVKSPGYTLDFYGSYLGVRFLDGRVVEWESSCTIGPGE
jgi:hypothetical protein